MPKIRTARYRSKAAAKHPRTHIICHDGTWNYPGQEDDAHPGHASPTNVYKLYKALAGRSSRQLPVYYAGVGNEQNYGYLGQLLGGVSGWGADVHCLQSYLALVDAYRRGDRICLFGFSRGAAIARMLAALIHRRGIPDWVEIGRKRRDIHSPWKPYMAFSPKTGKAKIEMLGVWDTVASFGVPKDLLGIPFQQIDLFKNFKLAPCVKKAYHLLAIDEHRDAFRPTLFEPSTKVEQVWFAGNHANVGGGYYTHGLSDITLQYMVACAEKHDLRFRRNALQDFECRPDPVNGVLRQERGDAYAYIDRHIPAGAHIHDSVLQRLDADDAHYAPENLPARYVRVPGLYQRAH